MSRNHAYGVPGRHLTPTEARILMAMLAGANTQRQVAEQLGMSRAAVDQALWRIRCRFGLDRLKTRQVVERLREQLTP